MSDDLDQDPQPAADSPSDAGRPADEPFDPWEGDEPDECPEGYYRRPVPEVIEEWARRDPGASGSTFADYRAAIAGWIGLVLPGWRARVVGNVIFALPPSPSPPQVPPAFALLLRLERLEVYACAYASELYEEEYFEAFGAVVPGSGFTIHAAFLDSVELADTCMFDRLVRVLLWPDSEPSETEWCPRDDIRDAVDRDPRFIYEWRCR